MQRYGSIGDVIALAVIPALGEYADSYDVEAIAHEAFSYKVDEDWQGNRLLGTAGFEQICSADEFWSIAAKHEVAPR